MVVVSTQVQPTASQSTTKVWVNSSGATQSGSVHSGLPSQ